MFVGVVAVGLLVGWVIRSQPRDTAALDHPAPEFSVDLLDGGQFVLSEHLESASGPLVLNLWASWCEPCKTEMPDLDQFARDNPEVTVIGVAVNDQLAAANKFADEVAVSYPLAFGNRDFEQAYPVFGLPVTYVINDSGVVTALHRGILNVERLEDLIHR